VHVTAVSLLSDTLPSSFLDSLCSSLLSFRCSPYFRHHIRFRAKRFLSSPKLPDRPPPPKKTAVNLCRLLFRWVKRPGRKPDHCRFSSAVASDWTCTPAPPIRLHSLYRDSCTPTICTPPSLSQRLRAFSNCSC
jgi:hypothetical protein